MGSETCDAPDPASHIGGGTRGVCDQQDQEYRDLDGDTVSVVSVTLYNRQSFFTMYILLIMKLNMVQHL